MYLEKEIQVYAMDALTTWLSQLQPWEVLALYGLGAVIFGTANKRLQRWRCYEATACYMWIKGDCGHTASAILGYPLWPIMLTITVLYSLVESHPSQWLENGSTTTTNPRR